MHKKLMTIMLFSILGIGVANAQFTIGPRFGLSSSEIRINKADNNSYSFETGERKVGLHVGAFSRITMGSVYIQPEVLLTSTGGKINLKEGGVGQVLDYKLNKVDIPVLMGLKMGKVFRIQGGPIISYIKGSAGNNDFKANIKDATVGYQAGIGFDIGNMMLDLKYEDNLSKLGNKIGGVKVDQRNHQVIASVGFRLF